MGLLQELFDPVTLAYQQTIREALRSGNIQLAVDLDWQMQSYVELTKRPAQRVGGVRLRSA